MQGRAGNFGTVGLKRKADFRRQDFGAFFFAAHLAGNAVDNSFAVVPGRFFERFFVVAARKNRSDAAKQSAFFFANVSPLGIQDFNVVFSLFFRLLPHNAPLFVQFALNAPVFF